MSRSKGRRRGGKQLIRLLQSRRISCFRLKDTARFPRNLPTQFALGVTRRGGLRAIFAYQAAMAGASNQGGVITG